ncbi:cryptochrome/photolyase family protein (plasmid) [Persicobacter psychrovividus]|uniref:Cryptochrome/photolyase family protein n=2 Tax=Persicobacter psychrovividus TaxID=387638 RepID=A0ABM7VIA4_9BACT|nr:cryptochrome/photolyase family protein [Persicobacter psychrovividus]
MSMKTYAIVFPHQLFEESPLLQECTNFILVEEYLFFRQYRFHQQKLVFHRASMKFYEDYLKKQSKGVQYIEATDSLSDVRQLVQHLKNEGIAALHYIDPVDDWLSSRFNKYAERASMKLTKYESPGFLTSEQDIEAFFAKEKKRYLHHDFYQQQRKRMNILMTDAGEPEGGQWSFDEKNRKKYPKGKTPPVIHYPPSDQYHQEALTYVRNNFDHEPKVMTDKALYPNTFWDSKNWWKQFLDFRFAEFGPYEDAIVEEADILHHSVITPMLNVGLLTPAYIVQSVIEYGRDNGVRLSTVEGFIRQVIGWREFIRGMYVHHGRQMRTTNFWGFEKKLPSALYHGATGIPPVDETIKKLLKTGYLHHIERLMILGNFMLLCEYAPSQIYRWFMELSVDGYDWVMVPNVYGMSQFADGGLMATKPYISSSNYIKKMSDYEGGVWEETWDALFWRFMYVHRDYFENNPRMKMLLWNLDKKSEEERNEHIHRAEDFINHLNSHKY